MTMCWREWLWLDHHPLLDELNERSIAASLHPRTGNVQPAPVNPPVSRPATYSDGTTDELTRSFDVLADAIAAPGEGPDAA